jgi:hypothetical protein
MTKRDLVTELEQTVDQHGLLHVLTALETMCDEKAMFVDSCESIGTPDKALARLWVKCGKACRKAADIAADLP